MGPALTGEKQGTCGLEHREQTAHPPWAQGLSHKQRRARTTEPGRARSPTPGALSGGPFLP